MNNKKVSILMGVYNCEYTLPSSIESIISQNYEDFELIICDDNSRDNSYKIAMDYACKYKDKIKVIKNEKNLTLGPTLNRCLYIATGKYIARHDGDDTYEKDKLKTQVEFLERNPQFDLVGTAMSCFDDNGIYGVRKLKPYPKGIDLMVGTTFAHATIMIKSEVIRNLGGYCEKKSAKGVEDYELWFRFFHNGYLGHNLQIPLYNVNEDRKCYKRKNCKRRINEIITMYKGRKKLGLSIKYNRYLVKPLLAAITPGKLLMIYHRKGLV
jgi:glycosyltransferase EpsE